MKKILTMAACGVMSLSALAVVPQLNSRPEGVKQQSVAPERVYFDRQGGHAVLQSTAALSNFKHENGRLRLVKSSRAEESAAPLEARYMDTPFFTFYVGTTPGGYFYPMYVDDNGEEIFINEGIGAGFANFGVLNMSTGATSYTWEYGYSDNHGNSASDLLTANSEDLIRYVSMPSSMSSPLLTAKDAFGAESQYMSKYVSQYNFGPNLATFGIQPSQIWSDFNEEGDYYGVTTCPINVYQGKTARIYEATKNNGFDKSSARYFDENGCNTLWPEVVTAWNEDEVVGVKDVKFSFLLHALPEQQRPYLLYEMWLNIAYAAEEDVTLNVKLLNVDSEGYIDFNDIIGTGTILLPKGTNTTKDSTLPFNFIVELSHSDGTGLELDEPVPVYSGCAVVIDGIDNDNLTYFSPYFNGGTEAPADADINYYYNMNANIGLTYTKYEKANPENTRESREIIPLGLLAYGADTDPVFWYPTDFVWSYNVVFPFVMNDEGTNHLEIAIDAEGGEDSYIFDSIWPIVGLIEDGSVEVDTYNADWFTYEFGVETVTDAGGEYDINVCEIKADPLPEGEEGRCGVIMVRGLAQDFNLYVGQGDYELTGINQVSAPMGKVQYYDLQGRSIKSAPANGIYIERIGNKATKKVAK